MGVGMVVAVAADRAADAVASLGHSGVEATVIGGVVAGERGVQLV
jgi:phosphoribosylaminoimidazole (AIR) synthetase